MLFPQMAQSTDKKLHNIETWIVKGATILAKVVNSTFVESKLKSTQQSLECGEFDSVTNKSSTLIDDCNDTLALMGHSNKQINLDRKDFFRPELTFTKLLFGDDISKLARKLKTVLRSVIEWLEILNPFPYMTILQQTTLKIFLSKNRKSLYLNE